MPGAGRATARRIRRREGCSTAPRRGGSGSGPARNWAATGRAAPVTMARLSMIELWRTAAMVPSSSAAGKDQASVTAARVNVAGNRCTTCFSAGWPRYRSDSPKSPRTAPAKKRTNCSGNGRSSPIWTRSRSTSSWLASGGSMIRTGSPVRLTMKNTRSRTPRTTTSDCSIRPRMYRTMAPRAAGTVGGIERALDASSGFDPPKSGRPPGRPCTARRA